MVAGLRRVRVLGKNDLRRRPKNQQEKGSFHLQNNFATKKKGRKRESAARSTFRQDGSASGADRSTVRHRRAKIPDGRANLPKGRMQVDEVVFQ